MNFFTNVFNKTLALLRSDNLAYYIIIAIAVGYILYYDFYYLIPLMFIYGGIRMLEKVKRKMISKNVRARIVETFTTWTLLNSDSKTTKMVLTMTADSISKEIYDPHLEERD